MIVDGSCVRPAIAGFLSAKRAKLRKHGHSTVPSAVLHHHQLPQLRLQSRGPLFHLYRHFETICDLHLFPHISSSHSVPPPSQHQLALVSALPPPASRTAKEKEKDRPLPSPLASAQPSCSPQPPPAVPLPDPPFSTSAPNTTGSESRRRNAEQRAAQLRADPLLAHVEPHRVFCALCRKWVQLRQDSTFCAYPWQQHRSKCVIRQSVLSIFFYQLRVTQRSQTFLSLCSEKKTTKVKTMDGVTTTHSGRVTPAAAASSDESIDNCELGAEAPGEEMDTTTTSTTVATEDAVVGGPDADAATDNLATRYANLDSSADRYVCFPFSPLFHNLRDDRATRLLFVIPSLMSLSRHIARHLSLSLPLFLLVHRNRLLGGDVCILFPTLCPPHTRAFAFFGGWLDRKKG
jgi:hypothetical protein